MFIKNSDYRTIIYFFTFYPSHLFNIFCGVELEKLSTIVKRKKKIKHSNGGVSLWMV